MEVFSGLVVLNAEMEIIPDIAERWDISESGLGYTFPLRPDVQFHNGRLVVAGPPAEFDYRRASGRNLSPLCR